MEVFGPVQSRRLGISLGINHLPPKTCTYSCVYCQLGRTNVMTTKRAAFSEPKQMFHAIKNRLKELSEDGIHPDTITFVSNGEPTLDKNLGEAVQLVNKLDVQTAVITNASLLWHPDTRTQLMKADVVSLKVDSVLEATWHKIDRPHGALILDEVLKGIHLFTQKFSGKLITETMLISGLNDNENEARASAKFITDLHPNTAYLALPLRPPAEDWVKSPSEKQLITVYNIFKEHLPHVELMMDLPETDLPSSEKPIQALLNTLKVHPLGRKEIEKYLHSHQLDWGVIDGLINQSIIKPIPVNGNEFFIRKYPL